MEAKRIAIFGTAKAIPGDGTWELAHDIGKACAKMGLAVVNGGYGGIMTASAKGAAEAGGETIGVTCEAFGRSGPNEYIRREVKTADLPERVARLLELGDAYVILKGGTGTLVELAEVWELKNKKLPGAERPIIIAGGFWRPLVELICAEDERARGCIAMADTAEDVGRRLEQLRREGTI